MTKDEKRAILSKRLAKFRAWTFADLAARIGGDPLEVMEGLAADGTAYQIEISVFWDGRPQGDVRVMGDLSASPQKPLLGFLPIYVSDVTDSFIMRPDGRFVGEETP